MNRNTVGTVMNMLEKVATESNLSDIWEHFNTDESGIQVNSKPYSVITDKVSKNVRVLTSGKKSENITVIACML
jgi:ribosomal protein L15